jgi:hypothetical protein
MNRLILGNCKKCDATVTPSHVCNIVSTPSGRRFYFNCPTCKQQGNIFWGIKELNLQRSVRKAEKDSRRSQKIGNVVYGFKMDLDAFTVDEIVGLWEYDEKYFPESIPVETDKRVWLR